VEEADNCLGELGRVVGQQQLSPILHRITLGAQRCRHDGLLHRHSLQELEPCPPTHAQGGYVDRSPFKIRLDILHPPCETNGGVASERSQASMRALPHDVEPDLRDLGSHQRQDLLGEPENGVHIRSEVHGTGKDQSMAVRLIDITPTRPIGVGVDPVGYDLNLEPGHQVP
jgi:hypothetical protein